MSAKPLDQWSPEEAWQAWKPDAANPWSLKWVGHLHRRGGFGANWSELDYGLHVGQSGCLDWFLTADKKAADFNRRADRMSFKRADQPIYQPQPGIEPYGVSEHQCRWLFRMTATPQPLLERMSLFWHNHFATSVAKVQNPVLMEKQNALIRQHALGKFGPLLQEMGKDPAMLVWLDSNSNVKGHANENYAREVMELFSLGVGNYQEKDIQEAARAFTGWHTDGTKFTFNQEQHDYGVKTFLGKTGNWDGGDIVKIILEQPACAMFLVRKLYRWFINETAAPPDALLEPLAARFRKSSYDIHDLVGTMLRSRLFFSEHAYRQRVKSPIEFIIGLTHALERFDGAVDMVFVLDVLDGLGQIPYAPPNVKGWDGGKTWLNSATLLARHNVAWAFVGGEHQHFKAKTDPNDLVQKHAGAGYARQLDFLLDLFVQRDVKPAVRDKLLAFLEEGKPAADKLATRVRETAHLILLLPEYQLA